jgi:hypothetical protein
MDGMDKEAWERAKAGAVRSQVNGLETLWATKAVTAGFVLGEVERLRAAHPEMPQHLIDRLDSLKADALLASDAPQAD